MYSPAARTLFASAVRTSKPRNAFGNISVRTVVTLKDVKYTATATASGGGRNGHVEAGNLKLNLALPKELGGNGKGENPEQLFAAGYSACFLGALQAVAGKLGKQEMAKNAVVTAQVHIGTPTNQPGFGLSVDIKVAGIDEELLQAGHAFCPYSRALGQGVVVSVSTT
ncbi:organic hydroperoxide resistance protein [Crepidotus variabilis]|uniref:Organic hydroperoxide resistance protein n=1 Tax=Crepidotus variabilis TaxID=179855 RepID=A0A9P6ED89_9AGAR|nr:organic hydroperoxide resistance protein [Crepidotus variabilis]